jgi:nitrate/TMAO reductase-like tetraheme cytochrome c subunit
MMDAAHYYKASVSMYQCAGCHIPENSHIQICLITLFYRTQKLYKTPDLVAVITGIKKVRPRHF